MEPDPQPWPPALTVVCGGLLVFLGLAVLTGLGRASAPGEWSIAAGLALLVAGGLFALVGVVAAGVVAGRRYLRWVDVVEADERPGRGGGGRGSHR